ncbi:MAG: hypothetical protein OQK78_06960 [Gammaproteobacteria bacterium]|nr:hypothetical protein [Gammaproteobacteria bacterium]
MRIFRAILLFSATLFYLQSGVAAIKCWTNNEGYRECGNAVPPEYAQKETRTLNDRGVTTAIKQRAKTREELLREQQMLTAKESKAQEEKRKRDEQDAKDRVLLSTFLKPEEILAARDRKIAVFDGYLELSQITLNNLNEKLNYEQSKVADLERQGQKVPEAAVTEINSLRKQIKDKEHFIAQKELEKQQLREKYDADHKRFIELMERQR